MFDKTRLQKFLEEYKRDFVSTQWENEKYKWEAIKSFQDNWDVNATNFADMLEQSLAKTFNLLASRDNFPASIIQEFADRSPGEVRTMFVALFDESKDVLPRILEFKEKSIAMFERFDEDSGQHYQSENAISTYLWLRYPDKYYIYQYSESKAVAEALSSDLLFKRGAFGDNLRSSYLLYDELCSQIKKDEELLRLVKSQITEDYYPDPEYKTLTLDVAYYIARSYSLGESRDHEWLYPDYHPNISVNTWGELLKDPEVFTPNSLAIMKRMKDYGGEATCKQLSEKYGESSNFYNNVSVFLAKRVAKKTELLLLEDDTGSTRWWPILYKGRDATEDEKGVFVWKLRDELSKALDEIDLSHVSLYPVPEWDQEELTYWWLTLSPEIQTVSNVSVGEVIPYTPEYSLEAKAGDKLIFYESKPVQQIVALGEISSGHDGEKIYIEKTEELVLPLNYQLLKNNPVLEDKELFNKPVGNLSKLTQDDYHYILDMIRYDNPPVQESRSQKYTKDDFLDEVYLSENRYDILRLVLLNKKNIILQGAPGVGKTFAARRLAYSIIGEKDDNRIEFIQFHQNYSYEDFMMGYKPVDDGFELRYGIFYRFCQKAAKHPDKEFFFIIDEINRGNLSKIFGELLMLIERDYRGTKTTLAYNGQTFSVPKNIYIIGMMNTADRSLAMIDYALRRRFSFFDMEPGFDSHGFIEYKQRLDNETFDELINRIQELNRDIAQDASLGKGFCIGHSYFTGQTTCSVEWMQSVVEYDILPMLSEYWFDNHNKFRHWESNLRSVFQ